MSEDQIKYGAVASERLSPSAKTAPPVPSTIESSMFRISEAKSNIERCIRNYEEILSIVTGAKLPSVKEEAAIEVSLAHSLDMYSRIFENFGIRLGEINAYFKDALGVTAK